MLWLITITQTLLIALTAPLFAGILKWLKCQLQNRKAPSILQPYANLNKLFRKEVLIPATSSQIFRLTPYIIFSIMVLICSTLPLFILNTPTTKIADIIVIVGLFSLARFFLALAGMDTGTAFGGMGSSREMLIAAIAEPALLMVLFAIAMTATSTNLSVIINNLTICNLSLQPSLIFAAFGFVLIALAENSRIPIDNPATHLELTMIHEAMILEYSGRYLAWIEWAAQIKLLIYAILFINLFFPWGIAHDFSWICFTQSILALVFKLITLAVILGITETCLAKLRLFKAPSLMNFAFIFGLLAILIHIIIETGAK
jgi:formate hydrogenlyase subunit 4